MQSVVAWSSWEGTALLHRGSAGFVGSGSFKAGFRYYSICCFSSVPGGTACSCCVCRLETPLSVFGRLYLVLGVFLLDSYLLVWNSEPLLVTLWKVWFLSQWYLHWICLAEVIVIVLCWRGVRRAKHHLGSREKSGFHFPSFFLCWVLIDW